MSTLTLPAEYKSLEKISKFVVQAAREAGFNEKDIYEVDLAVDEACCNIIDHAYGGEGLGNMRCSVDIGEGKLTVTLKDHGRSFNPALVPKPVLDVPLHRLKKRGAGVYLIRKLMDELRYESTENGNILVLVKRKQ